ncbi:hypothetical protein N9E28_03360, partial [Alphaproteobacteria bacterium]|nr:hypothetical protein [Alphaproteobacteria bacterium]
LHIPSESLLAAIRVQWWVDALSDNDAQTAPLVTQLHAQFQTHDGLQLDTIDLIGHWQTACHDENRDNSDGWAAVWAFVAKHMGQAAQSAVATDIGHQLHHAIRGHKPHAAVPLNRPQISALRRNDAGQKRSFLYLAACWLHYVQRPNADANHPALVLHMLAWQLFGSPR